MPKENFKVCIEDVQKAYQELHFFLPATPLVHHPELSEILDCQLYLKLENFQPIGSFKIRGASYKIGHLSSSEKQKGIIAASAGNHAQGVAWGAKKYGIKATIIMPEKAMQIKIDRTRELGAEVILLGSNYDDAFSEAKKIQLKRQSIYIHAFQDPAIIAGQGTVALEILNQLTHVDYVFGSVGGGGLMAGVGTVFKALSPKTRVLGCQASGADAMIRSVKAGKVILIPQVNTFADGIAVKGVTEEMRQLLQTRIDDWVSVTEEEIAKALLLILEKAKVLTEGAGATSLAAAIQQKDKIQGKNVVVILSGGNIDFQKVAEIYTNDFNQKVKKHFLKAV